ncbi:replication protein A 32 kDa subunit-B [Nilaparvata lugens]|uniref:replication protein A 32 kDa subunit-B n=1 Tax=Nilaparvata lugens TaxID=108931 RepID=UPI00193DC549|nr:replication protein A 32 kDa subunit-B [Nilaparvata lugens]
MWQNNDDGFGGGGGGFDSSVNDGQGTPAAPKKRSSDTIAHVSVRQILECKEDALKIGNTEIGTIVIVGIAKNIETSSVKIVYNVEDNSGSISVMLWLNADENDGGNVLPDVAQNDYCTVYGKMRVQNGKQFIIAFSIKPVTDLKALVVHKLKVAHTVFKLERLAQQENDQYSATRMESNDLMVGGGSNMFGGSDLNFGLNPQQLRVYKAVQQCKREGGSSKDEIASALTVKMPKQELENILEFLVTEGHIYTTQDDSHYLVTDFT